MKLKRPVLTATAACTVATLAACAIAAGVLAPSEPAAAQQRVAAATSTAASPRQPAAGLRLSLESMGGTAAVNLPIPAAFPSSTGPNGNAAAAVVVSRTPAAVSAGAGVAPGVQAGIGTDPGAGDAGVRGVVRAAREATLSSRLAARIAEMPLADGASFKQGELLVKFDCERQAAEARAATAAVDVQKKTVETNVELDKFESIGKNDLSISRSQLDKVQAEADALQSQVKDCKVVAPFSGRVIERMARMHEAVAVSQPLLRVADMSTLELDLIVPSAWLQWLAEGAEFQFHIDETGQTVAGTIARLTPAVDPVSKTIKVIGRFRSGKAANLVLPGMSGTARFEHRG